MKNIELVHDMRNEILQLKDLGRMPNESINDTESIDELVNTYDALLEQIQLPISFDEAMVLVQIFPENAFYDLLLLLLCNKISPVNPPLTQMYNAIHIT